jgi:MoxR-like ATPase
MAVFKPSDRHTMVTLLQPTKEQSMAEINFGNTVTLKQAAQIIAASPSNRYILRGEPGIGKSSLTGTLREMYPDHHVAYIDVPNMDLGDIAMPVIDHESKTTKYYPNSRFQFHTGKPVIVVLDEFSKGAQPVQNMLHPLLESHNPRLGDIPVHPDSLVFLTGNLTTDGVGDSLKAHTVNRIIPLIIQKPSFEEWAEWAVNNDIAPEILAFGRQVPQLFASYTDPSQKENAYIFNPQRPMSAFVSPRSLERASNIVKIRRQLDTDSVIAALKGAIGEAAARDFQAYLDYADQLPTWESTITNPKSALVPSTAGAAAIVVFGAIQKVTKTTIEPFMQYLERFEEEWQAAFAINIAKSKTKQDVAFSCDAFAKWVAKNEDLL